MAKEINIYLDSLKFGGIEKNLVSILNNLNPENYNVTLIFLNKAIGEMYGQINIPFRVQFLCSSELSFKKLIIFSNIIKFLPRWIFRKIYRIPQADIEVIFPERIVPIFANKLTAPIKCSWNQTSVEPAAKLKYFSSGLLPKLVYKWGKYSYQKIDHVICNSELCKQQFEQIWSLPNKAIAIPGYIDIANIFKLSGADGHIAKKVESSPEHKTIHKVVFVGRLSFEKNIDLLLEALSIVSQQLNLYVYIVGDGPERKKIEAFSNVNGTELVINLLGYLDNPYKIVSQCDCLVSSSRYEGFGLTAVEALACGCPVVSVDNGGVTEILANGNFGIVTQQSAQSLAAGIMEMLNNETLRQKYIERGYVRAQQYDISYAIKKIEKVFNGEQID